MTDPSIPEGPRAIHVDANSQRKIWETCNGCRILKASPTDHESFFRLVASCITQQRPVVSRQRTQGSKQRRSKNLRNWSQIQGISIFPGPGRASRPSNSMSDVRTRVNEGRLRTV